MQAVVRRSPLTLSSERGVAFLVMALFLASVLGCSHEPQIEQYTVKREKSPEPPPSIEPRDRMLGAIVPQGDKNWFFKLTGSKQTVAGVVDTFRQFVQSIRFSAGPGSGNPTWKLPEGWTQKPGSDMRYATIEIAGESKPMELTVIPLPRDPGDDDTPGVLANVNRWRGQLSLLPLAADELPKQTEQIEVAGIKVTLVDYEGTLTGAGMAPFAGGGGQRPMGPVGPPKAPAAGPAVGNNEPAAVSLPFAYSKPAGWIPGPAGGLRKLVFRAGENEAAPELTVIDLAAQASETLPNVNRWRMQVGLADTTTEQLAKDVKKLSLGAAEGEYVELMGEAKAILGVIVRSGDQGWFFKLTGDRAAVEKEKSNFDTFMQSVLFK